MSNQDILASWRTRGIELEPSTIEDAGSYEVVVMLGNREPADAIADVRRSLTAAGFHSTSLGKLERPGPLLQIMTAPNVASCAMKRNDAIVLAYAMRGGLPLGSIVPCRACFILQTSELLGPWAGRDLEDLGKIAAVSDEHLEIEVGRDAGHVFAALSKRLVATGARIVTTEAACKTKWLENLRTSMRRAGAETTDPGDLLDTAPREVRLRDRDQATLELQCFGKSIHVTRLRPAE